MAVMLRKNGRTIGGLSGTKQVIRNLGREIKGIEGRSEAGLLAAAKFIEGESNEQVPQKHGVLIGSSFARPAGDGADVGYSAEYAAVVHEMPDSYNFTKPGTGPKFLQRAISENMKTILEIVRRRAKI